MGTRSSKFMFRGKFTSDPLRCLWSLALSDRLLVLAVTLLPRPGVWSHTATVRA